MHLNVFKAIVLVLAASVAVESLAQPQPKAGVTPAEIAAEKLPVPKLAPGELPPDCQPNGQSASPPPMESPAVMAQFRKDTRQGSTIIAWARKHLNANLGSCLDWRFAFRKLQEALGHEATGVLTLADLAKVTAALEQGGMEVERRAQAGVERQDISTGRGRTVVDFLPKIGNSFDRSCNALVGQTQAKIRQEVARRVAQLPPHMMRSANTGAIEREEVARAGKVAPEWQALWQAKPALEQWARANDCNVPLRIKVEAWQMVIGSPADALDSQAVTASEQLLAKAEDSARQFGGQLDQSLQAEADRNGETARARTWSLETLSGRSKQGELASEMPTALCVTSGTQLRCAKLRPCDAEQQSVAAARGQRSYDQLTRPLAGRFEAPSPNVGKNIERLAAAEDALKVCHTRYPYTAAAKSALLYAGQQVSKAELDFDARGLIAMRLTMNGDDETTRNALTRRYGLPETQQEIRQGLTTQSVGGVGVTPTGQQVLIAPTQVAVPTTYTVTKYIWKSSQAMVENSGNSLVFRFTGN